MKKIRETQRGITLIALVITIVILIILATVTLNVVLGDGGLIQRAQDAKDLTEAAAAEEQQQILNLTGFLDEQLSSDSLVEAFKAGEIKVGDYVDYKPDANSSVDLTEADTGYATTQTYSVDSSTTWRVLGLSEDGNHLLLTSGSPIKKDGEDPYLVLQGATSYLNCVATLDKAASVYHNSELAEDTRSMTMKDIENVLGGITVTLPEEGSPNTGTVTFNKDASHTNIGQTTPYRSYTYTAEDYTPEGAATLTHATAGTKVNGDAYMIRYDYDGYQELGLDIDRRTYDMLFKDTTEEEGYSKSYWLASPGVGAYSGGARFGPGAVGGGNAGSGDDDLFSSDGGWFAGGFAVRPVVVLKSNVTVDQVKVVSDKTEATWSTSGGNSYGSGNIAD